MLGVNKTINVSRVKSHYSATFARYISTTN